MKKSKYSEEQIVRILLNGWSILGPADAFRHCWSSCAALENAAVGVPDLQTCANTDADPRNGWTFEIVKSEGTLRAGKILAVIYAGTPTGVVALCQT